MQRRAELDGLQAQWNKMKMILDISKEVWG